MKKTITILMALMFLFFTQCKPTPEGGDENSRKVKVSCTIPISEGDRSDFTNLMETGKVNWSEGYERVYLAIHGENPQIIELKSWAEGTPSNLEFTGEAAEGLIMSGEEYDIWYFGHSQQLETPYFSNDGESLTGSIANQSGRLEDLGYCHIATTKVTAVTENGEVKLNLKGTLANQIAIALLDLENVDELYGDAIIGTEYTLSYDGERYELDVTEDNNAKIEVESASGISYVALLPNDKNESMIKHKKGDKTYAYTFHGEIKANKIYYRSGLDGTTPEALKWEEIEEETNEINGHEYVDLGLPSGLLWATCNVGAETPEAYGNYYAWGETEPAPNNNYSSSNCSIDGLTYSQLQSQGYIDNNGNLTSQYDAATANWGGDWRMPTRAEQEELLNNCTWTWTTQNGVNGYKVSSKVNSKYIFLPAAGYRYGSSLYYAGSCGCYWSSTPYESDSGNAYYLYFDSDDHYMRSIGRYYGRGVRPVCGGGSSTPSDETITVNGVSFKMIAVEGGTFSMGATSEQGSDAYDDESPVHSVTLSDYHIGETEVTQELWQAVMGSNPSNFSGYPQRPVEQVSWNDCQEFITKLNNLTGKSFRLPTEAEWEYAARGGNKSQGYKYSGSNTIGDVAWYWDNSSSGTQNVKTKQANELGIYDMSGNVYEWCQDWYGSYSSGSQTNPAGPTSGFGRVFRGGSWYREASCCRVSDRSNISPSSWGYACGLRLVL